MPAEKEDKQKEEEEELRGVGGGCMADSDVMEISRDLSALAKIILYFFQKSFMHTKKKLPPTPSCVSL